MLAGLLSVFPILCCVANIYLLSYYQYDNGKGHNWLGDFDEKKRKSLETERMAKQQADRESRLEINRRVPVKRAQYLESRGDFKSAVGKGGECFHMSSVASMFRSILV